VGEHRKGKRVWTRPNILGTVLFELHKKIVAENPSKESANGLEV
jgi:hypothetical protein